MSITSFWVFNGGQANRAPANCAWRSELGMVSATKWTWQARPVAMWTRKCHPSPSKCHHLTCGMSPFRLWMSLSEAACHHLPKQCHHSIPNVTKDHPALNTPNGFYCANSLANQNPPHKKQRPVPVGMRRPRTTSDGSVPMKT